MTRLVHSPKNACPRDLPLEESMKLALQYLREHPDERPCTAAQIYRLKDDSVCTAWNREKKRALTTRNLGGAGMNRTLRSEKHQAMIRFAVDHATNRGKGATKQTMYNCAMRLRVNEGKKPPYWRWF